MALTWIRTSPRRWMGHQSISPIHRVKLRFAKGAASLGEDYIWNATQTVTKDREGRVVVEFDTGALYAVERQVLAWGGKVAVLAPIELKGQIHACAAKLMRAH